LVISFKVRPRGVLGGGQNFPRQFSRLQFFLPKSTASLDSDRLRVKTFLVVNNLSEPATPRVFLHQTVQFITITISQDRQQYSEYCSTLAVHLVFSILPRITNEFDTMAILRIHLMLSVLLVLAAGVLADFTIMSSDLLTKGNDGDYHMKARYIFVRGDGHLNCDNLWNVPAWEESIINDVSGDKQGVRYKGVRPTDPTLIEFNTNFGHYSTLISLLMLSPLSLFFLFLVFLSVSQVPLLLLNTHLVPSHVQEPRLPPRGSRRRRQRPVQNYQLLCEILHLRGEPPDRQVNRPL
jgi:hypothetical protein